MYLFFRDLAIILIAAKFFGLIARKLKAPQVVGEIIAGLLIGPSLLGVVQLSDTISVFAEIGVILLMFSTLFIFFQELCHRNVNFHLYAQMSCTNGAFAGQFMPYCGCGKKGMCLYPPLDFRSFLQKTSSICSFFLY